MLCLGEHTQDNVTTRLRSRTRDSTSANSWSDTDMTSQSSGELGELTRARQRGASRYRYQTDFDFTADSETVESDEAHSVLEDMQSDLSSVTTSSVRIGRGRGRGRRGNFPRNIYLD